MKKTRRSFLQMCAGLIGTAAVSESIATVPKKEKPMPAMREKPIRTRGKSVIDNGMFEVAYGFNEVYAWARLSCRFVNPRAMNETAVYGSAVAVEERHEMVRLRLDFDQYSELCDSDRRLYEYVPPIFRKMITQGKLRLMQHGQNDNLVQI